MAEQLKILIAKCCKDDRKAQFQLFDLFLPYVTVVVRRYLIDQNAVSDLSQEIFITVFKSIKSSYDPKKGGFKPWLRKIAIHHCFKYNKTNKTFDDFDQDSIVLQVEPSVFNALSEEDLMRLIQKLPAPYRAVFNMAIVDGYSHQEVGELLGISIVDSRKKLSRARAWLSKRISPSSLFNAS